MKVRVLCVGKVTDASIKEAVSEYVKRLNVRRVEFVEVPDSNPDAEGKKIIANIKDSEFVVALSENGEDTSSTQLAEFMEKAPQDVCFIIGGPDGLSREVLDRADKKLSLSRMTFTHEMARLILVEQIYRAFMINGGRQYHR